ncbi:hypothetical protein BVY01_03025 [bacterium I07]|nr:hypothetical protein BVY01_03025 [bacterium I07]
MASLQEIKRKTGIAYSIRHYLDGEPKSQNLPIGTTKKEASDWKIEFEARLARHKTGTQVFNNPLEKTITFHSINDFRRWFLENKKMAKGKNRPISKRTIETYDRAFHFLLEAVGDITILAIENNLNAIADALAVYQPATRSILIRSLRQA